MLTSQKPECMITYRLSENYILIIQPIKFNELEVLKFLLTYDGTTKCHRLTNLMYFHVLAKQLGETGNTPFAGILNDVALYSSHKDFLFTKYLVKVIGS